tara:strand:+ start:150 stop:290 length:141 start_codon:yes stop_codon:yes gene_type:complete
MFDDIVAESGKDKKDNKEKVVNTFGDVEGGELKVKHNKVYVDTNDE